MAWTTPGTATAGSVLTASWLNTNVRDNTADLRSYQNRFASYRYATGSGLALTGTTTWSTLTTIGTAADLTLNASAGDVIEGIVNFTVSSEAVSLLFDWVTVMSGTVTNSFSLNGAAPAAYANLDANGYYSPGSAANNVTGSMFYTLTAGDIASGTITLRLRYVMGAATNRTILCSSTRPIMLTARNLGPVTT